MRMTLHDLLARQYAAQRSFGADPHRFDSIDEGADYVRLSFTGAVTELGEVMNEIGWKPWKGSTYGVVNGDRVAEELADVFLFVSNLALACRVTSEQLQDAIEAAWEKNQRRQREGY